VSKCGEFMGQLFFARDAAHREHLRTRSFSQHMALGEFYAAIIGLADTFAEAYQGEYDLIPDFDFISEPVFDIEDELRNQVAWITKNRGEVCPVTDTPLQNIIDEIVGQYRSTLYKLKFLA